jgi:hypothetical protein
MASTSPGWFRRHSRLLIRATFALLVAAVAVESFLLYQQREAMRAAHEHSEKLLNTFLRGDTAQVPSARGVSIRLQNVRFKWSDKVYVDTADMALRAVPIEGKTVDFDDLGSFLLTLQRSTVLIRPQVLEGMLNESVFNYPGSDLRDLKVKLAVHDNTYAVEMTGKVDVVAWFPFSMTAFLTVDTKTNTLVMRMEQLKVLGFLPATTIVRWTPLHLARLISIPPNKSLMIDGNKIMVKPFGLFPPPRVTGVMSTVSVDEAGIHLTFAGNPIPAPKSMARNYVYLRGGASQFGHFCMVDTDVLVLDQNPATLFGFSLARYADLIPRSNVEVHDTRSVRVTMPDS